MAVFKLVVVNVDLIGKRIVERIFAEAVVDGLNATDGAFLRTLRSRTVALQPMVAPAREQAELVRLLRALAIRAVD